MNIRYENGQEVPFIEIYKLPIIKPALPPKQRMNEAMVHTRELRRHNKNHKLGIGVALGAVALSGFVAMSSFNGKSSEAEPLPSASISATPLAEKTPSTNAEMAAKVNAQIQAKLIADHLNKNIAGDMSHYNVTILNGTIVENAVNLNTAKHITAPLIQDAILLSTVNNKQPDANGKFLEGAWLGVIGPQDTIKMPLTVSLFQFDSSTMSFETSNEPTITAAIFATQVNLVGQGIAHETVAFNINDGSQLYNDNGRPIYVGESLTNKG